jgi:hypothetical protein
MYHIDIRKRVLSEPIYDIEDIINLCSIDQLSQQICSKVSYWKPIFEKYNLPFPDIFRKTSLGWITF